VGDDEELYPGVGQREEDLKANIGSFPLVGRPEGLVAQQ
jgi:hypothetical protein